MAEDQDAAQIVGDVEPRRRDQGVLLLGQILPAPDQCVPLAQGSREFEAQLGFDGRQLALAVAVG
ncbi:hypothetical protein ABZ890_47530 [Streptomyces sp. NPDC046984]|uniref:hypothetical protein n=1 Tax=Streptomyces sp. NPDC046984 TaxID=3155138 RepID=UPI0033F9A1FE